jgi:hypothetical protein
VGVVRTSPGIPPRAAPAVHRGRQRSAGSAFVVIPSVGCVSGISSSLGPPQAAHLTEISTRFLDTASAGCFLGKSVRMRQLQMGQAQAMTMATRAVYYD